MITKPNATTPRPVLIQARKVHSLANLSVAEGLISLSFNLFKFVILTTDYSD